MTDLPNDLIQAAKTYVAVLDDTPPSSARKFQNAITEAKASLIDTGVEVNASFLHGALTAMALSFNLLADEPSVNPFANVSRLLGIPGQEKLTPVYVLILGLIHEFVTEADSGALADA